MSIKNLYLLVLFTSPVFGMKRDSSGEPEMPKKIIVGEIKAILPTQEQQRLLNKLPEDLVFCVHCGQAVDQERKDKHTYTCKNSLITPDKREKLVEIKFPKKELHNRYNSVKIWNSNTETFESQKKS